jgi:hypothetical protein
MSPEADMVAPFYPDHCATCGRETLFRHDRDPKAEIPGGTCDECGTFVRAGPEDGVYWVTFTNMTDLSIEPAPGEYELTITRPADSAAAALQTALRWALEVMQRVGLPPHGLRLEEAELRRDAVVLTDLEAWPDFVEAVNRCLQRR